MAATDLVRLLWLRRGLLALAMLLGAALGGALSFVLPESYSASAQVVVDVTAPDPVRGTPAQPLPMPSYMATQLEIVRSERVARRVVELLDLEASPQIQNAWRDRTGGRGSTRAWIVDRLLRRVDARPSRDGGVLTITARAASASEAAALANAFATAYVETTVRLRVDPAQENAAFFQSKVDEAYAAYSAAHQRLSDYQRENEIVGNADHIDVQTRRLIELTTQLTSTEAQLADAFSRRSVIASRRLDSLAEAQQSPVIQELRGEITRAEGRLRETASRYGSEHPQYQSHQAELATLNSRLQAEIARVGEAIATSINVNLRRAQQLRSAIEAQQSLVLQLQSKRDEMALLQRESARAHRELEEAQSRLSQTMMISQNRITNVSILAPAEEPYEPTVPNLTLNVALASLVALLSAMLIVLVREAVCRKVRSPDEVVALLDLPVLAVVPRVESRYLKGRPRQLIPLKLASSQHANH